MTSYDGPLLPEDIVSGIQLAQTNARRLIQDARILFSHERYPSSAALAILAIGERGKALVLRRFTVAAKGDEFEMIWKEFRSHQARNSGWKLPPDMAVLNAPLEAEPGDVATENIRAATLDALKQIACYTDFVDKGKWRAPWDIIDANLARSILDSAIAMWGDEPISEQEIGLWMSDRTLKAGISPAADAVLAFNATDLPDEPSSTM